jgi:hypothetical protein
MYFPVNRLVQRHSTSPSEKSRGVAKKATLMNGSSGITTWTIESVKELIDNTGRYIGSNFKEIDVILYFVQMAIWQSSF